MQLAAEQTSHDAGHGALVAIAFQGDVGLVEAAIAQGKLHTPGAGGLPEQTITRNYRYGSLAQ